MVSIKLLYSDNYFSRLYIFCFIFISLNYHSQNFENLKLDYKNYRNSEHQKILSLTKEKNAWLWLSLLPSVSVSNSYNPFTGTYRPVFSAGISLSNIATYLQTKNRNRIEREKLSISLSEKLNNEILNIDAEILEIQRDSISLVFDEKNLVLLEELFLIKSKQYDKNQINLEEKIKHQINLNNSKNAFEIKKLNYLNRKQKLINKLKKQ